APLASEPACSYCARSGRWDEPIAGPNQAEVLIIGRPLARDLVAPPGVGNTDKSRAPQQHGQSRRGHNRLTGLQEDPAGGRLGTKARRGAQTITLYGAAGDVRLVPIASVRSAKNRIAIRSPRRHGRVTLEVR